MEPNPNVDSEWISVLPDGKPLPGGGPPLTFVVDFDFTLPVGFSSAALDMQLCADDRVTQVDVGSCTLFGPGGNGGNFLGLPLPVATSNPICFQTGLNTLSVTFQDTARVITGLAAEGTVTYAAAVGGTVELLGQSESPADASGSSARDYTAPMAAVAGAALVLAAAGWYARRRWLR